MNYNHQEKVKRVLENRLYILDRCSKDLKFRDICLARASKDCIWWINTFVTTYNPRVKPSVLPLVLFPKQEDAIAWILERYQMGEIGTIVKARYTGASWLAACILAHKLLFEPNFVGAFASNKAESVDKLGNPDTLFSKLTMVLQWLPKWMQSIDMDKDRKIKLIRNSTINSTIIGQSGRDIGRGGRSSLVFVDEFAFVQFDMEAVAALSENTDCCIYISTPNGTANKFYELAHNNAIPKFFIRWQDDPRRDLSWRLKQTELFGSQIAAQELDCDFKASVIDQFIEYKWIEACINAHLRIPKLKGITSQAGLDVAVSGNNKTVFIARQGSMVEEVIAMPPQDTTQTALKVNDLMHERGVRALCFDSDGVGFGVSGALDNIYPRPKYDILEFHGGGKPSDREWEGLERTSQEIFLNKRAEAWAIIRWRIKNTYDHLNGIQSHTPDEMISIPNDNNLITDLTKPVAIYTTSGKLKLESKQEMRRKGISSPDYGDALAYAFYEDDTINWIKSLL